MLYKISINIAKNGWSTYCTYLMDRAEELEDTVLGTKAG